LSTLIWRSPRGPSENRVKFYFFGKNCQGGRAIGAGEVMGEIREEGHFFSTAHWAKNDYFVFCLPITGS
jgi:hypothetical protein